MCGGTEAGKCGRWPMTGLSPRVRGNPDHCHSTGRRNRSIPACAGETRHPNARRPTSQGLSPRVRGNPFSGSEIMYGSRSIPACAGEPEAKLKIADLRSVYPRVCGGTASLVFRALRLWGLSPRVRGNLQRKIWDGDGNGSIPACAGEPCACRAASGCTRVYPRVCGGTPTKSAPSLRI